MAKTYFGAAAFTVEESWRTLRTLRAAPPEPVAEILVDASRRDVWHAGLEQSQQQFLAASRISYDSRPLNLFYGLTQAARALAAGSPRLGLPGGPGAPPWRGRGHGLEFREDDVLVSGLWAAKSLVAPKKAGDDLLSVVSEALQSPLSRCRISMGALVSQLPEFHLEHGVVEGELPSLTTVGVSGLVPQLIVPTNIPLWLPVLELDDDTTAEDILAISTRYPAYESFVPSEAPDTSLLGRKGSGEVQMRVLDADDLRLVGSFYQPVGMRLYRGHLWAFPRVGDTQVELHPLQQWWLILHALSILARYAPGTWVRLLSLTENPSAPQIELLLDEALTAVPQLVAEAIENDLHT